MTLERRLLISLTDIRALTLECTKCGARLSLAPNALRPESLSNCPSCGQFWMSTTGTHGSYPSSELLNFLRLLAPASKTQQDGDSVVAVRVFFDVSESPQ